MRYRGTFYTITLTAIYTAAALFASKMLMHTSEYLPPFSIVKFFEFLKDSVIVLAPYLVLYIGYFIANNKFSMRPMLVGSILSALPAILLYWVFFFPNDTYITVIFVPVVILQSIVAVICLFISIARVKGISKLTPNQQLKRTDNPPLT